MLIKAGNITNLTEARYFSSKAVSQIGFNFNQESENAIAPIQAQQIIGWLEGPEIVAEFANERKAEIQEIITVLNLQTLKILIHRLSELENLNVALILQCTLADIDEDHKSPYILQLAITEKQFQEHSDKIKKLIQNNRVILEMDWTPEWLLKCMDEFQPYGINFNGSGELKTGAKSFEQMDALFELMQDEF
ncbi:MAG: hypothetical protein WD334_07900 [Chitinophagales bacterium]